MTGPKGPNYWDLTELLQSQTVQLYKHRPLARRPVMPNVFQATRFNSIKPLFASYSGLRRSTPGDVRRIFGETSLTSEDDKADVVYKADDLELFEERRQLARQLDKVIGDIIVID